LGVASPGSSIPWKHAARDLLLVALTLFAWRLDGDARAAGSGLQWLTAPVAGALTAIAGYLFHEWGHLAGARLSGATVRLPARASEIFLFNFHSDRNSPRQFLAMSMGGFIASAISIVFLLYVLPLDTLAGKLGIALVALGVLATAVLELPPFFKVMRGAPLPRGTAYVSDEPSGRS
jgi:hypothetical protein